MSQPALIDIRNATIWRGTTRVFEGLDLRIEQHERVAILGPNGSGKTTLLKTINREIYPVKSIDSHVRILGRERWNVWDLRRKFGIVSDDLQHRYAPQTSALDVVVSGFHSSIGVHGTRRHSVTDEQLSRARTVLDTLGIADLAERDLQSMSTGQQRRCLLGRALVHAPGTLILDEPTTGLDFAASLDYLDRIRELSQRGCNIVLVTHHINEIPPEVMRVIVLQNGRVVADGPKNRVLDATFLSEIYGTAIRIIEIDGYFLPYPGRRGAKT
jgi:iron complex transport system ATP-binding protein